MSDQGNKSEQPPSSKQALREQLTRAGPGELPPALRERAARLILDEMYQFTGLLDPTGVVLEANLPALQAGGLTREEVIGRPAWEARWWQVSPQVVERLKDAVRRAAAGEFVRYETEVCASRSGAGLAMVDLSLTPIRDESGAVVFLLAERRDITEKKRTEAEAARVREIGALRQSEARFRGTFENAAVGIAHLDLDGHWLRVNQTFCDILGYDCEELLRMRFQELTHPDDLADDLRQLNALMAGRISDYSIEKRYFHRDGRVVWVGAAASMMRAADGTPQYAIVVVRDISQRKAAEEQLKQLNETLEQQVAERTALAERRTRQLRRLASEITQVEQRERRRLAQALHDHLQQLLATARMGLGALRKHLRQTPLAERLQRVDELLGDSLEVSRSLAFDLSPPVLHDAGLAAALAWLGRHLRLRYELEVELHADSRANPTADYTGAFLYQATRELLLNVLRHAGVRRARVKMSRLSDERVQIVVSDQGGGFAPEALAPENDPEGFGLFNIRERLELLGGEMEIDSRPGRGASVRLIAPRHEAVPNAARRDTIRRAGEAAEATEAPTRVLVVDDHQIVRRGLARLLDEMPAVQVVGEAANGRAAVEMARRLRPDVILMDITMPIMDGVEATRRITGELPGVRVVGLSIHAAEDMEAAMQDAGAAAYLAKGGPLETLAATIRGG